MAGVLNQLKVLDLTSGIAGPMTTMLLGDNGADVIKIEPPGGDPERHLDGPQKLGYAVWQRGKRSAFLDLTNAADKDVLLALVKTADILVETYAPGEAAKLGLDYDSLSKINPRLIVCSITGYGRNNPHSNRPALDSLVQARSGLMFEQRGWAEGALNHISGLPDPYPDLEIPQEDVQGADREGPLFTASQWPSLGAFFNASLAIAAAVRAREITGKGQWVETSLIQGAMAGAMGVWQRAEKPESPGFDTWILNSKSSKGHFQAKDGKWLHNWVPNPRFILQAAAGDRINATPDLTVQNDPDRFGTGPEEILVMSFYQPQLAEAVAKFPVQDWIDAAATAEMTMQPVRSIEESLADPMFLKDGCVTEMQHPELGTIRCVGNAYNMSATQGAPGAAPVAPGANTDEIKAEAARIIADAKAAQASATGKTLKAPLDGIVVLDLGLAIAGPFGTQLLSDLGATVIKINGLFDLFWHRVHIAYMANRGKQSITLNLKDPRAMKILLELVKQADVVQHNMRYDAAERLKIDYESLKQINPTLIYAHSRGFERGERSKLPGNDQTGACLTGIQFEDGGMGREGFNGEIGRPLWSFTSFGDTGNGYLSATSIVQAIYHRDRTGEGQFVDTSIVNAGLLNTSYAVAKPDGSGFERPRIGGDQLGYSAYHRIYKTADLWLCVVARSDAQRSALLSTLGAADATQIGDKLAALGAQDAFAKLDAAGVPVEIVDPEFSRRLHDQDYAQAQKWVVSYPHPHIGKLDQIGLLYSLSDTPAVVQGRPLIVGENTQEIMARLGYSEDEINTMEAQMAVGFAGMPRMPARPAPGDAPKKGVAGMIEKEANK
ncbi:CaiB/BaiF CoA-transferase family protein [Sinimarinibacterium sp. NLF-5-8]|uniref:CaiB/BaiF CoA transferase family protein n=1 Tax=Sinimarinibacterium sp. NLF-5-8 TaxID=2698684 RepID=UPI00137BC12B|nr:CoA transferase [Sinimarinibacterium sp. NLF-5-8]QHS11323.1 CoA transferase [Sinimarinibacterium sp. NLF-5-8]